MTTEHTIYIVGFLLVIHTGWALFTTLEINEWVIPENHRLWFWYVIIWLIPVFGIHAAKQFLPIRNSSSIKPSTNLVQDHPCIPKSDIGLKDEE